MSDGRDHATVFTASLACVAAECSATFEVHSAVPDHGLTSCPFCGGSLMELVAMGRQGEAAMGDTDKTQVVVTSGPASSDARDEIHEPALVVPARRGRNPDTWGFTIDELSVTEFGFTHEEAMAKLLAAVRKTVQHVADDEREPEPRRELARRLRLSDAEGRLEELLTAALVLDDEDAERLLREHAPQPPEPA